MKTIETIKCLTCGKLQKKRKSNHAYCSILCCRNDHNKKKGIRLLEIKQIAGDIVAGRRQRSYLTKMGLNSSDKKRIDCHIKNIMYGNN